VTEDGSGTRLGTALARLALAERLAADADELVLLAIELGRRQAADEPGLIRRVAYQQPRRVAQHAYDGAGVTVVLKVKG
jgi:hypothetical protein